MRPRITAISPTLRDIVPVMDSLDKQLAIMGHHQDPPPNHRGLNRSTRQRNRGVLAPLGGQGSNSCSPAQIFQLDPSSLEDLRFDYSRVEITNKTVNYNLNSGKAVIKKLDASNRDCPCTVTRSNANSLMLHCQAGLYEYLRGAAFYYYCHLSSHRFEPQVTVIREKGSNLIVQTNYKITERGNGPTAYTLSFYHTKSAIQINGRSSSQFIETDWPELCSLIESHGDQLNGQATGNSHTLLNDNIRSALTHIATDMRTVRPAKTEKNSSKQDSLRNTQAPLMNTTHGTPHSLVKHGRTSPRNVGPHMQSLTAIDTPSIMDNEMDGPSLPEDQPVSIQSNSWDRPCATPANRTPAPIMSRSPARMEPHRDTDRVTDVTILPPDDSRNNNEPTNNPGLARGNWNVSPPPDRSTHIRPSQIDNLTLPPENRLRSTPQQYPSSPQEDLPCEFCVQTRHDLQRATTEMQSRERKLASMERSLKQRERESEKQIHQLETQKALVIGLENQVRELTATNRLLQQALEATGRMDHSRPPAPEQLHTDNNNPQIMKLQEELHSLKQDMKLKDLESRMTAHIQSIESRMFTLFQPPAILTGFPPPTPWGPHPIHHGYPPFVHHQRPPPRARTWQQTDGRQPPGDMGRNFNSNPGRPERSHQEASNYREVGPQTHTTPSAQAAKSPNKRFPDQSPLDSCGTLPPAAAPPLDALDCQRPPTTNTPGGYESPYQPK